MPIGCIIPGLRRVVAYEIPDSAASLAAAVQRDFGIRVCGTCARRQAANRAAAQVTRRGTSLIFRPRTAVLQRQRTATVADQPDKFMHACGKDTASAANSKMTRRVRRCGDRSQRSVHSPAQIARVSFATALASPDRVGEASLGPRPRGWRTRPRQDTRRLKSGCDGRSQFIEIFFHL
jgi:hypothetical protein